MKKLLFFLIICLYSISIYAQNPQGFNYQAVARDPSTGYSIINTPMTVRLIVQSDSAGGTGNIVFWQETHSVSTNSYGLINVVLGKGHKETGTAGTFGAIDWSVTPKFIKTEIDYGGWKTMGSSRFWSVPYSIIATGVSPGSSLKVVSGDDESTEALFEVKRKDGQTVFAVYNDAVNVYVPDQQTKKAKGGFSVGGFDNTKGFSQRYLTVTPDSIRFFINDLPSKSSKGGFSVGGFDQTKGSQKNYLSLFGASTVDTITNASQILWYPKKEAFLAGRIDILNPDSVGQNSFSTGFRTKAIGNFSHAMGYESIARGPNSTAIGHWAIADTNSFALGNMSRALGNDSYAIGSGSIAAAPLAFALGVNSTSTGEASLSLGFQSIATHPYSVAIGYFAKALQYTAHAFGLKAEAQGYGSLALGMYSQAKGQFSSSLGFHSIAASNYSTAIGYYAFASGFDSYAIGSHAEANGEKSFAIGSFGLKEDGSPDTTRATWTPGYYSLAFGMGAQATHVGAMSLGVNTTAAGDQSLSIGFGTNATNQFATAMGYKASANGFKSIAIGAHYHLTFDKLVWEWSATLGKWIITTVPTPIDKGTSADGDYSIAIGNGNYSNNGGLTLGTNNNATAFGSVAIGHSNEALSDFSFVAGFGNYVEGLKSFALGENLTAKAANSFIIGAYNKTEGTVNGWLDKDPLFVIGNGNPGIRSNAFAVLKDGNIVLSPNIVFGTGLQLVYDPADNLMKKLTSSTKYKTNITPLNSVNWLYELNPVSFQYINDTEKNTQYGLIAEDIEVVKKDLVIYLDGKPEGINYNSLFAPMIKALQDQKIIIDDLDTKNSYLTVENEELKARLDKLEKVVASIASQVK